MKNRQAYQSANMNRLELISETTQVDLPPMLDILNLQTTGTPNDIYYYHPNHLGSTSFVTDQNQTITQGFLYAPFGEITTEYNVNFGNNVIPKYSFNAKELDEETGMFYYEARYYAPPVFTSRDVMFEKYFWMSPYAYCANNPVKYVDPDGREFVDNERNRVRVRVLKNGNIQYKFSRKTSETAKSDFISNHSESLSALSKTKQGRKCISFLNRCYTSVYINPTNESGNQNSLVIPSCDENNYVKMNNGVYENVEIKPFMGSIRNKANQDNVDVDEILGATLIVEAGHLKKNQISRDYNEKLSEESKYYSLYNQYVDYRYNYRKELKQPINETVFNNSSNIHPKLNRINSKRKMQYVK